MEPFLFSAYFQLTRFPHQGWFFYCEKKESKYHTIVVLSPWSLYVCESLSFVITETSVDSQLIPPKMDRIRAELTEFYGGKKGVGRSSRGQRRYVVFLGITERLNLSWGRLSNWESGSPNQGSKVLLCQTRVRELAQVKAEVVKSQSAGTCSF